MLDGILEPDTQGCTITYEKAPELITAQEHDIVDEHALPALRFSYDQGGAIVVYLQSAEISSTNSADPVSIASSLDVMLVSALSGYLPTPFAGSMLTGTDSTPLSDDHFHGNMGRNCGITTTESTQSSPFTPHDRAILTEPPLEGELVLNPTGQVSAEGSITAVTPLRTEIELSRETQIAIGTHLTPHPEINQHRHNGSTAKPLRQVDMKPHHDISDFVFMIRTNHDGKEENQSPPSPSDRNIPTKPPLEDELVLKSCRTSKCWRHGEQPYHLS